MAKAADKHGVAILGGNPHAAEVVHIGQTDLRPGLAAVCGFPHTIAGQHIAAQLAFAGGCINDIGVGLAHRHPAKGRGIGLAVGHRLPAGAAIGRLPQAAAGCGKPVFVRTFDAADGRNGTATARRSDVAPFQAGEIGFHPRRRGRLRRFYRKALPSQHRRQAGRHHPHSTHMQSPCCRRVSTRAARGNRLWRKLNG